MPTTVAALFVQTNGTYFDLPFVDPWDAARDARLYQGPWPIVAHPPCERWGRYWGGGPSAKVKRKLGDDDGCFASALASVRRWGGVLEHPEGSHAFDRFNLGRPSWKKGWVPSPDGGLVCCVAQGNYGHRARKLTWLYASNLRGRLPDLDWTIPASLMRLDTGMHSKEEGIAFRSNRTLSPEMTKKKKAWLDQIERAGGTKTFRRLGKAERARTPDAFRDVLLQIARNAGTCHTSVNEGV